jgi:hypothetical protein
VDVGERSNKQQATSNMGHDDNTVIATINDKQTTEDKP